MDELINVAIENGTQIIGGLVNVGRQLIDSIGAKKRSVQESIRKEALAVENINKAYSSIFTEKFNDLTTGASSGAYQFIKKCWDYIRNNPIIYEDKKDKISGNKKYEFEFEELGNGSTEIRLVKTNDEVEQIIYSEKFSSSSPIVNEETTLVWKSASNHAANNFDMNLLERANKLQTGKSELSLQEIEDWQTLDGGTTSSNNQQSTKSNTSSESKKGVNGLLIFGGLTILTLGGWALFSAMKKSKK